jgi:hypothetical protein
LKRKLKNGQEVEELQEPIALIIWTKVPDKWQITDLETGVTYMGNKEKHPSFAEMLRQRVMGGPIGQWKKNAK